MIAGDGMCFIIYFIAAPTFLDGKQGCFGPKAPPLESQGVQNDVLTISSLIYPILQESSSQPGSGPSATWQTGRIPRAQAYLNTTCNRLQGCSIMGNLPSLIRIMKGNATDEDVSTSPVVLRRSVSVFDAEK